jgi:hypothetical protein
MLKHSHFGKVRAHRHTSYAGLFFVLIVTGVVLLGYSVAANAADPAVNPQSGSVGLTGRVLGPPPTTPAIILNPRSGSRTTSIPITVSGTCPTGTFVSINRNGVFGGAVQCQDDGTFSLLADLFDGNNTLVARVSDTLGQFGPNSSPVSIFFEAASLNLPGGSTIGKQLFLQTNTTVVSGNPNENINRTVTIIGGAGPYAISWDWGDDETTLMSQQGEGAVTGSHKYERPGTYRVVVRVTDSQGNSAYLEFITVVNGPTEQFGASKGNGSGSLAGTLIAAWPLYLLALLMVIFFWLGERRELRKLKRKHLLVGY